MIDKRYSLNDILLMDQYIMDLASYESTKGMLIYPTDIDSLIKLQQSTRSNFNQFKKMIRNNECSIEELEQMVISRHGPIPNSSSNMTFQETIESYANKSHSDFPNEEYDYSVATKALLEAFNNALLAEYETLDNMGSDIVETTPIKPKTTPIKTNKNVNEKIVKKASVKKPRTKPKENQ
jgi:hypothetical protein